MKVPGSDNWHYRRDVPADVRKAIGVTRWSFSLGTANLREAAEKARALAADHDRLIAFHRRKDPLETLSSGERKRVEDAGGVEAFMTRTRDRWQRANLLANVAEMTRSYPPEGDDPDDAESDALGLEATARGLDASIVKDGPILDQLGVALPARLRKVVEGSADSVTLRQIFNKWNEPGHASEAQYRIPMELFERKFGLIPVGKISTDQCREFRDHLASGAGSKHGKREDATSSKYFTAFKTLLTYAENDGYFDRSPADKIVWRAEKIKHSERMKRKRRTFSPVETDIILKALSDFAAESYEYLQVAWFVRIACWSGMRPEEIAQLAPGDVCQIGDIWALQIHDVDDNNVKTFAGIRAVPVHQRLMDEGFLGFVESRRSKARLFALCEKVDGRGRRYPPIYSRWTHILRDRLKLTDPKLCMYSFRHGVKSALRLARVGGYEQGRILGHGRKGQTIPDGYGIEQMIILNECLQKADLLDPRRTVTLFNEDEEAAEADS
jgi:integrase